ncbi:MAG: hypothetical protein R2932_35805 [Caldilineaceae bacterium]
MPLLPGRALNLIDIGVLLGIALTGIHWLLARHDPVDRTKPRASHFSSLRKSQVGNYILTAIIGWAFLSTLQATHETVAWREWRTVFLYAGLFAGMIAYASASSGQQRPHKSATNPSCWERG